MSGRVSSGLKINTELKIASEPATATPCCGSRTGQWSSRPQSLRASSDQSPGLPTNEASCHSQGRPFALLGRL